VDGPNVLLVVLDTARADRFVPHGGSPQIAPAIAGLAGRGTAIPRVFATSNWTLPSHVSLFTGLLPSEFGVAGGSGDRASYLATVREGFERHRARTLPAVLGDAGYDTRAVSANPWIRSAHGFGPLFDDFADVHGARPGHDSMLRTRLAWWRARHNEGAAAAREHVAGWIREARRPFFWFANLMECHSPYLPPRPYDDLGPVERWRAVRDATRHLTPAGLARVCVGESDPGPEAFARMGHLYGRAIRYMDDWLSSVLEDLDRAGMLDDTLVVVTSDHGEHLGEHGLLGHTMSLAQRLLHVPLISAGPTPLLDDRGTGAVSLARLPALLAEAIGMTEHPWTEWAWPGIAPAHNAGLGHSPERQKLAAARGVPAAARERLNTPMECALDGRFKLLRTGENEALYDLDADPEEGRDVSAAHPERVTALRAALVLGSAPAQHADRPVEPGEEAEIERHLEALGYL